MDSNLPDKLEIFIGRHDELEEIGNIFNGESSKIIVINGYSGVGKTSLALEYGNNQKEENYIVRFIEFNNGMDKFQEDIMQIAQEIGLASDEVPSTDQIYQELSTFDSKFLFIFDNVNEKSLIAECLKDIPENVHIIITTRIHNLLDPEYRQIADVIHLKPISSQAALEFFIEILSRKIGDDQNSEMLVDLVKDSEDFVLPFKLKLLRDFIENTEFSDAVELVGLIQENEVDNAYEHVFEDLISHKSLGFYFLKLICKLPHGQFNLKDLYNYNNLGSLGYLKNKLKHAANELVENYSLVELVNIYLGIYEIPILVYEEFNKYLAKNPDEFEEDFTKKFTISDSEIPELDTSIEISEEIFEEYDRVLSENQYLALTNDENIEATEHAKSYSLYLLRNNNCIIRWIDSQDKENVLKEFEILTTEFEIPEDRVETTIIEDVYWALRKSDQIKYYIVLNGLNEGIEDLLDDVPDNLRFIITTDNPDACGIEIKSPSAAEKNEISYLSRDEIKDYLLSLELSRINDDNIDVLIDFLSINQENLQTEILENKVNLLIENDFI